MIVFCLDSLTDDSHRRHFIDPTINPIYSWKLCEPATGKRFNYQKLSCWVNKETGEEFKPDYESYNAACGGDQPIMPVIEVISSFYYENPERLGHSIQVWTDRCEGIRTETVRWLDRQRINVWREIKMRPIGDDSPQEVLFEKWLRSECNHISLNTVTGIDQYNGHNIEMVFSSHKPTIQMFRSKGVFVFDCGQGDL